MVNIYWIFILCSVLYKGCLVFFAVHRFFSSWGEWGLLSGFSCCRAGALGAQASVVEAHGLSCPTACGVLVPRPGIEPMSSALAGGCLTTGPQGSPGFVFLHRTVVKKQSYGQRHLLNKHSIACGRANSWHKCPRPPQAAPCRIITAQVWGSPEMWTRGSESSPAILSSPDKNHVTALPGMKRGGEGAGGWNGQSLRVFPPPFLAPGLSLATLYSHPPAAVALHCPLAVVKFLTVFTIILSKKIHHDYGDLSSQSKN